MRCTDPRRIAPAIVVMSLMLGGCNAGRVSAPALPAQSGFASGSPVDAISRIANSKIKHVVIIVQENRSFNNLFYGYPGATTATYGYDSKGEKIALQPLPLGIKWKLEHDAKGFFAACNGTGKLPGTNCRMNGFDRELVTCGGAGEPPCPILHPQYSYVPATQTKPYFQMAQQYVLADHMFGSDFDTSSFVSHQYIIAGQAQSAIDYPNGAWGCPGGTTDKVKMLNKLRQYPSGYEVPCWNPTTLGDELDKAGLTWAFYAAPLRNQAGGIWSAYQAIDHIYNGPDWKQDVKSPSTQFFTDLANGDFRNVTWITPVYSNSDHPGNGSDTGPSWVASLVNAIGESPYWSSTAIFIMWDEYGGEYDPIPAPYVDYDGLGLRIPLLIVSPYAKKGVVSHVQYEHGSILRFIENQYGLGQLAASDRRAAPPGIAAFDWNQAPRPFVPITAPYSKNYFLQQPVDDRPVDDN